MRSIPQHIINRLKQQPRQGSTVTDAADALDKSLNGLTSNANLALVGLGKFIEQAERMPAALKTLAETSKFLEERTSVLAKTFGLNVEASTKFYARLTTISKDMGVGASQIAVYSGNLQKLVGAYANLSRIGTLTPYMKDMLRSQKILTTQIGLTDQQANNFQIYASLQGKTATQQIADNAQIVTAMNDQLGYNVTAKELLGDMSNLTGDILLQYGKMPGNLQMAVTKAKLLGMSMDQLNKSGQKFLNIESSIGEELEYQLLSGRRLVDNQGKSLTNAFRTATIQGNASKQADLMNEIISKEGDTIRNNLFARQQLAKTLGVEEAQLARTLAQQEMLKGLEARGFMGKNAEALAADIKASGVQDKEALLAQLEKNFDERTTEQKMLALTDVMASTMVQAFGSPEDLAEFAAARSGMLTKNTENMGNVGTTAVNELGQSGLQTAGGLVVTTDIVTAAMGPVNAVVGAFKGGISGLNTLFTKLINGTATVAVKADAPLQVAVVGATDVNDVAMGPSAGRVILGPEGAFNLNSKDSIIAGTNLGGGGPDMAAFAAAIVSAINSQTAELTRDNTYWS